MVLRRLSDRVYYLPAEERTDRPVLGYVKGDRYSLAVDAGNSADHVEKFYGELKELHLRLPDFTVVTHWHWDHTFGMHSVSGKTVAGHLTNERLSEVQGWQWTDEAMEMRLQSGEDIEACDRCIRLEYPDRTKIKVVRADIEFAGAMSIYLGGVHCEIGEFNAPHSSDSVLVHVPEEQVVFIGDADCGDYLQNNGRYDRARLKEMIDVLEGIGAGIVVLGHGMPQTKQEVMTYLRNELK